LSEHFQKTLHCEKDRRFQTPCQPVRTSICPLFHQFGRRVHPDQTPDRPASSVQTTYLSVRTLHCIEKLLFQLASIRTSQQLVRTSISDRSASDSFQVQDMGRLIHRPDDVVSRPDALINKARIAIRISPSGRQSALVRIRVQLIWKLPIQLQPSGRLPFLVRTHA
jgi:hypothetical protein